MEKLGVYIFNYYPTFLPNFNLWYHFPDMKIIMFMAMSVNGIIARENGDEDFLSHDNWIEFAKTCNEIGCLIWGRKTYEAVIRWDRNYLDVMKKVKKIIVSSDPNIQLDTRFIHAISSQDAINIAQKSGFQSVILTGGSTNNSSFAVKHLIDEIILNIEYVILGKGIPLFKPEIFQLDLELIGTKKVSNRITQFRFKVYK